MGQPVSAEAISPETLFREGLHQEQTLRQPERAVETYRRLIDDPQTPRGVQAEAHLRLGLCLERTGRSDQARKEFERITRHFADYPSVVEQAKDRLSAMSSADPATLMPPETPVYVELVRPGLQIERFVASLKGLDAAGLAALLNRLGVERELHQLENMLSEFVREDLTHIDSVALGVISYGDVGGRINAKFLLVLHPGVSIAARGFLAVLAQTTGKPSGSHRDVKLWDIPDGPDGVMTFANLPDRPGLSAVMILGKDRKVVCDAIDRHRAGARSTGLASTPEFRRQAGAQRRDSTLLMYVDVPQVLARWQRDMSSTDRQNYQAGRQLLGLDTVERGMARVALLDDGVLLELSLMFNEKENPFYAMWRTPPADRTLLNLVPTDAAIAVLMSLGEPHQKWAEIKAFLEPLGKVGPLRDRLGLGDPLRTIAELEETTGLSLPEDLIGNCRSLAVILPEIRPSTSAWSRSPLANIVLALRVIRPDDFASLLDRTLLDRLRAGLETGHVAGIETKTYIDTPTASGAALSVARLGDVFLLSLSSDMLERVLRAYKEGRVVEQSPSGRPAAEAIPPSAGKIALIRPDLVSNGLRVLRGDSPLGLRPVRPTVVYTLEQPDQVALRVEIGDLTDVLNNIILAAGAATSTPSRVATTAPTRPATLPH
mgnify:CR=1 FL=1